ncbi:A-kinase anchor protein 12-like [Oncorhynchus tshawytscha]|uniref:A kinase-anchoring proteins AKAP-5 and AKAP-12 calmodulin (CaM)-binding domain-containing protein n=1 Tax=Oncorhynchus tshawytscha TaxID=74940 RepID=A0A8C8M315_ONCTS|nr:A-kinase anchor protein 12-like [Oncorhynchus tshawytscha]
MGAQTSAHRDGKSQEDASAENLRSAVNAISEGDSVVESKFQQKNGQNGQEWLNDHSEDNTLAEEVDGVSVSRKEEVLETMDSLQAVVASQVNREEEENESPDANNITRPEEKVVEEKPDEANEVGFKKIFNFIGFKFTLKKDKNEKTDPVQMLKLMDKEVEGGTKGSEETKEEAATAEEGKAAEPETATGEADFSETTTEAATSVDSPSQTVDGEATEKEPSDPAAAATTPRGQEAPLSPFRRFFTQGIFSNQRKKASIKRAKEKEPKEKAAEEKIKEGEEKAEDGVEEEQEKAKEEVKEVEPVTTPETKTPEVSAEEIKEEIQAEFAKETSEAAVTDDAKQVEENVEDAVESDKAPVEVTTEAELFSSQKKVKAQGSPLKKLFTGSGLKKLSTKKQKKDKKDTETKLTESGEQAAEQLQSSTESAEVQKPDSGASSPEESGEHAIGVEATQAEASQVADEEVTSSDEGKKKEGIMPWSSFKKLVTPKKRVKRPSESEDEATVEKAMSATLFSTDSAVFVEKKKEEPELPEEEPKAETTEDLEGTTEDPKKMKMDTSLSWEALMCMGGNKKRTRKTSDSEDEETKIEEEAPPTGEEQVKTAVSPFGSSGEADQENTVSSPERSTSPAAGDSTWDTLKRLVSHRKKPKNEERTDESGGEQVISDSEIPKEDSSFSLRKLIPGRRKKKLLSSNLGSGEEDSDTPAVVPLSEYDNEHTESKEEAEAEMTVETKDSEEAAPITQVQLSIEERSPSWISATAVMENLQEIPHDQLSDIPEEGAATPKSADTTIAEDIAEQTLEAVPCQEQEPELSVAEVTANSDAKNILELIPETVTCQEPELSVSEVTEEMIPATYGETTPLPNEPETESLEVPQEAVELLSDLPSLTFMEIIEIQLEEAASIPEPTPPIKFTETKSKVVLMEHEEIEGSAIYTDLGTKEITKVAVEKLVIPTMECLPEISNGLSAEMPVEDKAYPTEAADANEDPVFKAQVEQVESIFLEPPLEKTIEDIPDPYIATEGKEHEDEKVATINNIKMEVEIVEAPAVNENIVDPIVPTVEDSIAANIVDGSEAPVIEVKSKEEMAAVEEIAAVEEVNEPAAQEMVTSLTDANQLTVTEVCDAAIVAPALEFAIVKETTYLVCPLSESLETQKVEVTEAVAVEKLSVAVAGPAGDDQIQVQVTEVGITEAEETKEAEAMEEPGLVIAQVVIQSTVEKVSEAEFEPKAPASATATITTEDALPVQAVATIEKEIELVAEEKPVIAETPVVQVEEPAPETPAEVSTTPEVPAEAEKPPKEVHEAVQVIETIPVTIEITKSIMEEVTKEVEYVLKEEVEEIKHEVELKQAMEVNVSVEKVVEVEVVTEVEQTESATDRKGEEEIKEVEGNIEALEVQEVPQSEVEEVVKEFQLEVQQAEVITVVQEVIAEVPTPETAEEKSEAMIVTEETPVPDAPTETAEAPAQAEGTTAEVVVPQTTQVVIQATEIIEEAEEEIMVEVVEKDAIVSSPETKEAPAKEDTTDPEQTPDTPTPEPTPDTPAPAPTVADVVETNMKDDSAAVQGQVSDGPQTALEEHQMYDSIEAVAAIQDAPVSSMEEEVAVAMAVTVASPAEAAAEKATSVKCAEVMVQVIEEVVKEIKPVS